MLIKFNLIYNTTANISLEWNHENDVRMFFIVQKHSGANF